MFDSTNIIKKHLIRRSDLQLHPDWLFPWGDNLERRGFGGQAAEMRGEPNGVPIVTKKKPTMQPDAFFTDDDHTLFRRLLIQPYLRLKRHLEQGGIVIYPLAGVGTGRAELEKRAPACFRTLQKMLRALKIED